MSAEVAGALVFTDVAGFTAFTAERGDAAALALVERFEAEAIAVMPAGSRVVKQLGDGLFLWFPEVVPALNSMAALAMRCRQLSEDGDPLWVRTGVHHGVALQRGNDLIGHDVNIASRVTSLAGVNEVLVTAAARAAASGVQLDLTPLGPVFLRGIDEPVRLYRLEPDCLSVG